MHSTVRGNGNRPLKGNAVRGFVALLILLTIGIVLGSRFLTSTALGDHGRQFAIAFGAPQGSVMQMHVGVPPLIPMADPPDISPTGVTRWTPWIAAHFQLQSASGKKVAIQKIGTSGMLVGSKAGGSPEFALAADLKKGESYTFDFVPVLAKPERYRYSFTVPNEPSKVGRRNFDLVSN